MVCSLERESHGQPSRETKSQACGEHRDVQRLGRTNKKDRDMRLLVFSVLVHVRLFNHVKACILNPEAPKLQLLLRIIRRIVSGRHDRRWKSQTENDTGRESSGFQSLANADAQASWCLDSGLRDWHSRQGPGRVQSPGSSAFGGVEAMILGISCV